MKKIISFGICPFVQRAIITMNYKNIPYEVEYIDLNNKPDWFLKISPLGKVPVLRDNDEILFESNVINEYLDEISTGSLVGSTPIEKARDRGIIELSSEAIMNLYYASIAKDIDEMKSAIRKLETNLKFVLKNFIGPFYKGDELSLVDTSVIPVLYRLQMLKKVMSGLALDKNDEKKLLIWMNSTLDLKIVKESVPPSFKEDYYSYLRQNDSISIDDITK